MMHSMRWITMLVGLSVVGCAASHHADGRSATVNHVVLCWMKTPGDAAGRSALITKSKEFEGKIPGLLRVYAGNPLPSTRPIVDSSFDVAFVMLFKDEASLRGYEKSEIHQKALRETLQPLVAKFLIYDFTDRTNEKGTLR